MFKNDSGTFTGTIITQPKLPATPNNYNIPYQAHIQNALLLNDITPTDNPMTNDVATLGRVLFVDKNLSKNNKISCAYCPFPIAHSFINLYPLVKRSLTKFG